MPRTIALLLLLCACSTAPAGPPEPRPLMTRSPVDPAALSCLIPLGNLNPPAHTFPTDHVYFHAADREKGFAVVSPGAITITRVSRTRLTLAPGVTRPWLTDYSLEFRLDGDIRGRFGHVVSLDAKLVALVGSLEAKDADRVNRWSTAEETVVESSRKVNIVLPAGTPIGRAGTKGGALDLWIFDRRVSQPFINETIRSWYRHSVSPLDYFAEAPRKALEAKLGGWARGEREPYRLKPGQRGRIAFDKAGTAQGCWTLATVPKNLRVEDVGLALVRWNLDPAQGAISIGKHGFRGDRAVYRFAPQQTGQSNRDFATITPGPTVYWYASRGTVILIKLVDATTLDLRVFEGALPEDPAALWDRKGLAAVRFVR